MGIVVGIIKIIIWPITVLVSVVILRKGILQLIPNLKKLKYKDLELEFEKEAISIRASIERDIPKIEPPEERQEVDFIALEPPPMYSIEELSPSAFILAEWEKIEKAILSLSERRNIKYGTVKSVRLITDKLMERGVIDSAMKDALLELSAYRNRVAHTHSDIINHEISNTYFESSKLVINYLNSL